MSDVRTFPDGFLWGTATASYQIEGAVTDDGRGSSIWDEFCRRPGKVHHGDTGDIACDHYHRWNEDLGLMAGLGLNGYRFSIAWPRVQPTGKGPVEPRGLDFYRRLVDKLEELGVTPAATLYHWDLPQALQEDGGWTNRETAYRFAEYAHEVVTALGDRVALWITLNEPWVSAFVGHLLGSHAPGVTDLPSAVRASHHLMLAHGLAVPAVREAAPAGTPVGITLNLFPARPATASEPDASAARRVDGYHNRWFLDPLLRGSYPEDLARLLHGAAGESHLSPGDLETVRAPIDFLGVNYYTRHTVAHRDGGAVHAGARPYPDVLEAVQIIPAGVARTTKGWTVEPDGLTELLVRIKDDYGPIPLYITENGAAFADYVDPEGRVKDPERIDFLEGHLCAAHDAITAGVDLRGYFCWSLLDNFEWADGYSQRFGLVWVDYKGQERIPKTSAAWYGDVARRNAVELGRRP